MSRRLKQAAVVVVAVLALAQLVRPDRTNPPIDPSRTIAAHIGPASPLPAILDRSCGDCHSNGTVWPWYTGVAPLSWLIVRGVSEGRREVNFSEWAAYPPERQLKLLAESCDAAAAGKMPDRAYTMMHPEARLSAQDIDTICAAARQSGARATNGRTE